jgi:hypothetical protein
MLLRVFLAGVLAASGALAVPLPGLFNTGVGDEGALLPAGAIDPHWRLVASADAAAPGPQARVVREGYPIPPWLANGAGSKWIAPQADQSRGNLPGDYTYQLEFDLGGHDPATAVLTGRWSSDNSGVEVRLNGHVTGVTYGGDFTGFSVEFTLTSGFVEGLNVLEFVVNNAGDGVNPTGFRAELSGTVDPLPPPGTPPTITREPEDQVVAPKEPATFSVSATGGRPLQYQWRRAGVPLTGANTATFTLPTATAVWVGGYDVVVRNDWGAVTSRVATLTLRSPSPAERTYEPPGPSSRRTGLVFTEIMYHPAARTDGRNLEFIELHNTNPFFEDLGGWRISGDYEFTFPAGTILPGNGFLVVAPEPGDLQAVHARTNVVGGFTGALGNGSGTVRLLKRSGGVVLEVTYRDRPPWPVAADGAGHSLVLARPSYGEGSPDAWAASARVGGSPGAADPVPTGPLENVLFSEWLAHGAAGQSEFVELHNRSLVPVDLAGCWLQAGANGPRFRVPDGTVLAAGDYAAWTDPGFELQAQGQTLLLITPDETRVVDAIRFGGQLRGYSSGRSPASDSAGRVLARPTPGQPNAEPLAPAVVINELLYHPPGGGTDEEFIELFNPSSQVLSLAGWRFADGVTFEFPAGATVPGQGYVVVARDVTRFIERHPELDPARVFGGYDGALDNGGERVALARPEFEVRATPGGPVTNRFHVEVHDVAYVGGGSWGRWADGGGSSLELEDVRADARLAPNWAESDETARAPWTIIEAMGVLNLTHPGVPQADQLQMLLLGAGEALVDRVEVVVNGVNRVSNGEFENGTAGWFFQGTHRWSRGESREGFQSARSLRVVASERGDHVANRVRTALTSPIPVGATATIRARVRWLRGHPEILLRLRNGGLEASGRLALPPFVGTPGAPNSRRLDNAPPAITAVQHQPVLPVALEPVRVFARVTDPDGVSPVTLHYRLDPASSVQTIAMVDDGSGPDELPGDGVFTARLPGQPAGTLVAFWLEAADAANPPAVARFPDDAPARECLVRFGESLIPDAFGNYRLWLTRANHDHWAAREKMSNEDVPATFVYGNHRVLYQAGAHYSGSSYTAPSYNSPTGNLCGYDVSFPDDDRLLGDNRLTLDWPIRDDTNQREQLMYWFLDQYGLPNMYRRYVYLVVNGVRRGSLYDDVQQPGRDTLNEWFPDDAEGSLWKTDCWNEFDSTGNRIDPCLLNTLERFPASGPLKVARYRWNWRPRAVRGSANDFTDLFALVAAMNASTNYVAAVEAQVDVAHWMRTFAMNDLASFWDAFGNPNAKNTFLYKPQRDGWKLLCWDFDVGLGVFNDPSNAPLFDVNDPTVQRMYQTPAFVRHYWAALDEALDGFFRSGPGTAVDALLDAKYAAFRANQVPLASPGAIKSWITQRRGYLQSQLNTVQAAFAVTTGGGQPFDTDTSPVVLVGKAPVAVRTFRVNGVEFTPTWRTVTTWELHVPLVPGPNVLAIAGFDRLGQPVPETAANLEVAFTGELPPPAVLWINEWLAANVSALPDPADGAFDDWFELFNPGPAALDLTGWRFTDSLSDPARFVVPPGFDVPPHGYRLVWADGQPEQTRPGGDVHVNFRLDQSGEGIAVFDAYGRLVDALEFGRQSADRSEGRWPDGAPPPFYPLAVPSPEAPNTVAPDAWSGIRIVQVGALPSGGVRLSWTTDPGRAYAVRYREHLAGGTWIESPTRVVATGTTASWEDAGAPASGGRFYQVILVFP